MQNCFNRDPESIKRGIEASAEARRNSSMCRNNLHKMTPENTKVKTRAGREYRSCIACTKASYEARKKGPMQKPLAERGLWL